MYGIQPHTEVVGARRSEVDVFSELMFEMQRDEEDATAERARCSGLSSSTRSSRQFPSVQGLTLDEDDAHAQAGKDTNSSIRGSRLFSSVQGRVENQRLAHSENAMWE